MIFVFFEKQNESLTSIEKRPGPYHKKARQTLMAPADGLLFTLREYPVVYPGSLLARILTGGFQK